MKILSKTSLRFRLFFGFLLAAVMTIMAGGGGIISLQKIRNDMAETTAQVTANIDQQMAQTEQVINLRRLIDQISITDDSSKLEQAGKDILGLSQINVESDGAETIDLNLTLSEFFQNKKQAIVLLFLSSLYLRNR